MTQSMESKEFGEQTAQLLAALIQNAAAIPDPQESADALVGAAAILVARAARGVGPNDALAMFARTLGGAMKL